MKINVIGVPLNLGCDREGVELDGTVQSRISGISKKLNELVV